MYENVSTKENKSKENIFEGSFFFLRIIAKIIFIEINFHAIILLLIAFFIAITVVIFYFYSNKKKLLLSYTASYNVLKYTSKLAL